nr:hypothetical protein GCM10020092_008000 [Actinoplanes digitatis]
MSQPPGYQYPPPPAAERPKRRWWLTAIVVAWALALAGFGVWSVRHDPPTVAEQRDIAEALPVLQRATGAVFAAADAPDRVVTLGPVEFDKGCALTPVWAGVEASRDITVRVRPGEAPAALEAIAGGRCRRSTTPPCGATPPAPGTRCGPTPASSSAWTPRPAPTPPS